MALIERTLYPRFPTAFSPDELKINFTPSTDEIELAHRCVRGESSVLNFLALLKAFQYLHYFPHPVEIPLAITRHIHTALDFKASRFTDYPPRSLARYRSTIRNFIRWQPFEQPARKLALQTLIEAANVREDLADLLNLAIQTLQTHHFELPVFNTLETMARRVRKLVNQRYFIQLQTRLSPEHKQLLDELVVMPRKDTGTGPGRASAFHQLKTAPKNASVSHLREWFKHLEWLETLGPVEQWLEGVPKTKLSAFAAQALALDGGDLGAVATPRRYTLLAALIYQSRRQARDALIEMFVKRVAAIHHNAQTLLGDLREHYRSTTEQLVDTLSEVLELDNDESLQLDDASFGQQVRQILTEQGGPDSLWEACQQVRAYHGNNHLPLLNRFYKSQRTALLKLVAGVKIASTTQEQALLQALQLILKLHTNHNQARYLAEELSLDWASEGWRKLIRLRRNRKRKYRLDRRMLEMAVLSYVALELRSGDLYVEQSEEWADYRDQLLSWEVCQPQLAAYCHSLGLAETAKGFVTQLKATLLQTAEAVDRAIPTTQSLSLEVASGQFILKKAPRKEHSPTYAALQGAVRERMPGRNLLSILANTQHWTNWTRHFGPLTSNEARLEGIVEKYLLVVFGYGSGLGPMQLAAHSGEVVTAQQLTFLNRRHITATSLEAASSDLINAYQSFSLPKVWGDVRKAIADGTKIDLSERVLLSETHFRYGHKGAIVYHHISDTYIALFQHLIACSVWEATYILDGLLKNKSELQPDTLHADTQGQSLTVFGLSHLLGIRLMPRMRNLGDLIFYRPDKAVRYSHLDNLFGESIDWAALEKHWPDLMQVVLSIKAGKILPSTLLRKLGYQSRKNRLYQAFAELGKVIRTIFLLEYLINQPLRQEITSSTTKVERYNRFCDWISFGGEALLLTAESEERLKHIKYTSLLSNAIMLQNVVDLSRLLVELREEGVDFSQEDVASLSPYLTRHIRRFGNYVLDLESRPVPLEESERDITSLFKREEEKD